MKWSSDDVFLFIVASVVFLLLGAVTLNEFSTEKDPPVIQFIESGDIQRAECEILIDSLILELNKYKSLAK